MSLREVKPRRLIFTPRSKDPFASMIYKDNKSPTLKPVCVKSSKCNLKLSRSEEKITSRDRLPPLSPQGKFTRRIDIGPIERLSLKTPDFHIQTKIEKPRNLITCYERNRDVSFGVLD